MRVKYNMDDSMLASILEQEYGIHVKNVSFIPWGTSAYSYKVSGVHGTCYYLKLIDMTDNKQRRAAARLDQYLPITWKMHHDGIFQNITYPIKTRDGRYYSSFKKTVLILFHFIEGLTLKESSAWKETLAAIAKMIGILHKAAPKIDTRTARQERFDIWHKRSLLQSLSDLESTKPFDSPYKEALQGFILPRKNEILQLLNRTQSLQASVRGIQKDRVFCHGDLWAGNIIRQGNELFFIDWESSLVAPPERDVSNFIGNGDHFEMFFRQYENSFGKQVILHSDLLRFYLYQRRLTHLAELMMNILYGSRNEIENQFDLQTISHFYTKNHLDRIDAAIAKVQSRLTNSII